MYIILAEKGSIDRKTVREMKDKGIFPIFYSRGSPEPNLARLEKEDEEILVKGFIKEEEIE